MRYLYSILLLLCTSCIQLGGEPQPITYYLLQGVHDTAEVYSDKTLDINIELVKFPGHLDRPQIVTQREQNKIEFNSYARWGEPLKENLIQTLRENLLMFFPNANISISPWEHSDDDAIKIDLTVNSFTGEFGGYTNIDVRWTITHNNKTKRGHFTEQQPLEDTHHNLVTELNNSLSRLSKELANSLRSYTEK